LNNTVPAPASGGSISLATIGSPRFLNPILSQLNNSDHDLSLLLFSSLMKYDGQGNLIPDLAEKYEILDDGKTYDVTLRQNIKWHDGRPLNIDDVIFTLQTIQNSDYKSPLRPLWQGAGFEKIDELTIRFKLKNPYAPFLHTLTFGILPKHIWENVTPSSFPLNEYNLKPVGSGPYKFVKYSKDSEGKVKSLEVKASDNYFLGSAHISKITFYFYDSEEKAISAYKKGEVNALNIVSQKNEQEIKSGGLGLNIYSIELPRYFAIFFNQTQNNLLADKNIRQSLALTIDKNKLISEVLGGKGRVSNSPLMLGMTGYTDQVKIYSYDPEAAKNILATAGWKDVDDDGVLEKDKDNKKLEIYLATNDWPELNQTAQIIKEEWEKIGVKVNLEIKETAKIQNEIIRPRQYQALLFGEVLGLEPDPFSFWHSSQIKDPGLNLALYANTEVDKLLVEARQDLDTARRAQKYQQFSQLITEDLPAIFLFSPNYLFAVAKEVKGIELKGLNSLSAHFSQMDKWYINTKRTWK